jgi:hypothetical protein
MVVLFSTFQAEVSSAGQPPSRCGYGGRFRFPSCGPFQGAMGGRGARAGRIRRGPGTPQLNLTRANCVKLPSPLLHADGMPLPARFAPTPIIVITTNSPVGDGACPSDTHMTFTMTRAASHLAFRNFRLQTANRTMPQSGCNVEQFDTPNMVKVQTVFRPAVHTAFLLGFLDKGQTPKGATGGIAHF